MPNIVIWNDSQEIADEIKGHLEERGRRVHRSVLATTYLGLVNELGVNFEIEEKRNTFFRDHLLVSDLCLGHGGNPVERAAPFRDLLGKLGLGPYPLIVYSTAAVNRKAVGIKHFNSGWPVLVAIQDPDTLNEQIDLVWGQWLEIISKPSSALIVGNEKINLAEIMTEMRAKSDGLLVKVSCLLLASDDAREKMVRAEKTQLHGDAQGVINLSSEVMTGWTNNNGSESVKKNALGKAQAAHAFANHVREVCEGRSTISWEPTINYASKFPTTPWLAEFSTYHHNELGGVRYLFKGDENNDTVRALVGGGNSLSNLRENWAEHLSRLAEYFARAPREARTTPRVQLARIALAAVDESGLSPEEKNEVRSGANAIIAQCDAQNRNEIEHLLITPKKLLIELDSLVTSLLATREPIDKWEAMLRVDELRTGLDNLYDELTKFITTCNGRNG